MTVTGAPTIEVKDKMIQQGGMFNPLQDVTVKDKLVFLQYVYLTNL